MGYGEKCEGAEEFQSRARLTSKMLKTQTCSDLVMDVIVRPSKAACSLLLRTRRSAEAN